MKITIETVCPFCGHVNEVVVENSDFIDWQVNGYLAQDAFPYLTAEEREMLISGICKDCWYNAFHEEEEEEEDNEPDFDLDMGFDPYMGEYTWDC